MPRLRPLQVVIVLVLLLGSTSISTLGRPQVATPHRTDSSDKSKVASVFDFIATTAKATAEILSPHAQSSNVELVGQIGGANYAVAVQGNYAYIGFGPRLVILNISSPSNPIVVGQTSVLPDIVNGLAVAGNYAYVADGGSGLRIINVSNPAAPTEIGFYDTPVFAWGVAVAGNYAYIADDYNGGLRIINVSNPAAPTEVGFYDMPGYARGVTVAGNYAYVADPSAGRLRIINVSDPATPTEVGLYDTLSSASGVVVAGNYAYVADGYDGLRIINVSNPAAPTEVGFYNTPGSAWGVAVVGNYAYVADRWRGLRIINVSNPAAPTEVGFYDAPQYAYTVAVVGNYAYVTDWYTGLRVINISDPAVPTEVGFYDTPGSASGVVVAGNYAYVADGDAGLRIINVSNPAVPTEVGFYDTPQYAYGVAVAGNYAYVADGGDGLRIINVSNPAAPTEVGFYDTGYAQDVAVAGNYAYVADDYDGLRIINVSNPAAPTEVGFYDMPRPAYGVAVAGNYAYIADELDGLRILNASNPAAPTEVGFYNTPGYAWDVVVMSNYAYVADYHGGLRIINVSNPAAPTEVGFYDTPGSARSVAVVGNYAYIADESAGLRIINVSNPAAPTEVGFYDTPGDASGVAAVGNYAYVADRDAGLVILRFTSGPTYSISGQVTDISNKPVSGITVSDGDSSALTNSSGYYTITGLITGTYTITPVLTNYTFLPPTRTVTVPPSATGQDFVACHYYTIDSDHDGLLDGWELCGYDADNDGTVDVNLPEMGANPNRKDIFIEVDYMACIPPSCTPEHDHRPNDAAISRVAQAFATAPELGPITLHVDYGPDTIMDPATGATWGSLSRGEAITHTNQLEPSNGSWDWRTGWREFDRIKRMHFDPNRGKIFHYAVFAHALGGGLPTNEVGRSRNDTTSVESARKGSSDFVIALGGISGGGNVVEQAGDFMHELGHNLGLLHSGDGNACGGDECNYEPNYLSVMNYLFIRFGLILGENDGHIDYSGFQNIPILNELDLDETIGITGTSGYGTRYSCWILGYKHDVRVENANGPINWDCILGAGGKHVQADINADSINNTLTSFNDWANLTFTGGAIGVNSSDTVIHSTINVQTAELVIPSREPTWDELGQLYRPYSINLSDGSQLVASLGVTQTTWVTVTNTGALTATITMSATSKNGWFDTSSMPMTVSLVPSASLSIPFTYTVPSNRSGAIDDTLIVEAVPQESPLMGDSKRIYVRIGPLAWFEADPVYGRSPLRVMFTDYSVGIISSRLWSFGDGTTSTAVSPVHVYTQPGDYLMSLTTTGPDGIDTAMKLIHVSANKVYLPLIMRDH